MIILIYQIALSLVVALPNIKNNYLSVVPRLLFDGWQPRDFRELYLSEPKRNRVINEIINMIKVHIHSTCQ